MPEVPITEKMRRALALMRAARQDGDAGADLTFEVRLNELLDEYSLRCRAVTDYVSDIRDRIGGLDAPQ